MNSELNAIIAIGMHEMESMNEQYLLRKEQLIERYKWMLQLPRKKKKKVKRVLLLDWSINEHFKSFFQ